MTRMFRPFRAFSIAAVLALIVAAMLVSTAFAYEVGPLRIFLTPSNGRSQATITINNTRDVPLPVEILVLKRIVEPDGSESFVPAEEDFIVFPPQAEVPANRSQAVRIQYAGPPVEADSMAYVIKVSEVPVSPPGFSGVRFTYDFGVAVYVEPPRATAKLQVAEAVRDGDTLKLEVRNDGNKYTLLQDYRLILNAGAEPLELTAGSLAERVENPLLPPGMTRIFEIAVPELQGDGPVVAEIRDPRV